MKPLFERRNTLSQLQKYEHVLQQSNRSLNVCFSILAFDCGFGRLIKHILQINNTAEVTGLL